MGVYISFLTLNSIFLGLPSVSNLFNTIGSEQELPEALPAPGQHQYIKSTQLLWQSLQLQLHVLKPCFD